MHRLNDEVGTTEPSPGQAVELRWAAEHSYVIAAPRAADDTASGPNEEG